MKKSGVRLLLLTIIVALLFAIIPLHFIEAQTTNPPQAFEPKIVLKVGDWIEYNYTAQSTQEGQARVSHLMKEEVQSITGLTVNFAETATYPDGHIELKKHTSDINDPITGYRLTGYMLFSAGMSVGDVFGSSTVLEVTGESTLFCCGMTRTVLSVSGDAVIDKETGILLWKASNEATILATGTNIWGSIAPEQSPTPTPTVPELSILTATFLVIGATLLFVALKKKSSRI
jgi:hypothetical protein